MKFIFIFIFLFQVIYNINIGKKTRKKLLSQLTIKDDYKESIFGLQLGANDPCEDSFFIQNITLLNNSGVFFSIFDGHGGYLLSRYANLLLYPYFLESFNSNKFEQNLTERIINSLKDSYHRIEIEFLKIVFNERIKGNNNYSRVGSCAISAIIINREIYVANLGDSKARLFLSMKKSVKNNSYLIYKVKKVSKVFNIRKKSEQDRMKKSYPYDKYIYRCYEDKGCYVKGMLQPTRSLGDYTLKYLLFNIDKNNNLLYEQLERYYDGPYISAEPDINVYYIKDNYKYLIMGSDGLWDVIKSREIGELINNFTEINNSNQFWNDKKYNNIEKISYGLMHTILINYSKEMYLNGNYKKILNTPFGETRRNMHDDITIITCDISKYI